MKRFLKLLFPAAYGILNYATLRLLQDSESGVRFWNRPLAVNLFEITATVVLGYLDLYLVNKICNYNDQRSLATGQQAKLWQELIMVIVVHTVMVNLIITPMAALTDDGLSWSDFAYISTIPLLYVVVYYGIVRSGMFLKAYISHQLLVEKLTNDKLETELKFLKAQYHPHFLFNALNTVYFQMDEDVPAAKASIESLSNLLRYQLYDAEQQVPVAQELEYLQNYMNMQKIRASSKLKLEVDFDNKLSQQKIYPLLLLPLIENAFKYVGGNYGIHITAQQQEHRLIFRVMNDLPDFFKSPDKASGIGLENLSRRLELLYPAKHTLEIEQVNNQYIVTLELIF